LDKFLLVFVCTGNICRSPMAEGIMKEMILDEVDSKSQNLPVKVMSAGTQAVEGNYASEYALMTAREHGIDIHMHRSRYLKDEIVKDADLILTMERFHTNIIKQNWPDVSSIYELKNFGQKEILRGFDAEVIDPIGMGPDVYLDVFNDLKKELERVSPIIFSLVRKKLGIS